MNFLVVVMYHPHYAMIKDRLEDQDKAIEKAKELDGSVYGFVPWQLQKRTRQAVERGGAIRRRWLEAELDFVHGYLA